MSKFHVWIAALPGNPHWHGLRDVAQNVVDALNALGHEAVRVSNKLDSGRLIVFNAHVLSNSSTIPDDAILFNAEQVPLPLYNSNWLYPYFHLLRTHTVWDYSEVNIKRMRQQGVERAAHCPIGYSAVPFCERSKDVDVLFFGSLNPRREKLLAQIAMRGLSIKHLFGVYGTERDQWVARAKIVLCAHFYADPIFEIIRCAPLYSTGRCVVSESEGCDPVLESLAAAAGIHVPYDQIPNACAALVKDANRRADIGVRARATIEKINFVDSVRVALEKTQ